MANAREQSPLVIERILRDRDGIWQQITDERDLRQLTLQMLTTSMVSFAIFGLVLGLSNGFMQALSSMVKMPLLFLATLAICLPTLYLFNLVFGARLSMSQAVTLIMVAITVIAVLTLAFAPISLFFLITAQSYAFFKLLNVCILVLTAVIGLRYLTAGMAALNARREAALLPALPAAGPADVTGDESAGRELAHARAGAAVEVSEGNGAGPATAAAAPATATAAPATAAAAGGHTTMVITRPVAAVHPSRPPERPTSMALVHMWILLFGFVGTQLAWTLRPFFGDPNAPFALFRDISGTFYSDILHTIGRLFG